MLQAQPGAWVRGLLVGGLWATIHVPAHMAQTRTPAHPQLGLKYQVRLGGCSFMEKPRRCPTPCPQVAVFIASSCWQLFDCLRKGTLRQHPLFCYEEAAASTSARSYYEVGEPKI